MHHEQSRVGYRVPALDLPFAAIDFETANPSQDSACSIALVRVEEGRIVGRFERRIRPPEKVFTFTHIHGLRWEDVEGEEDFASIWGEIQAFLEGVSYLAAHHAVFDSAVLDACCRAAGIAPPGLPFLCTVQVARATWGLFPTKLPDVCRHLNIPLQHHDALSDAEACARIVLAAGGKGREGPGPLRRRERRKGGL